MANTSPRHMPVLGNVHPIKIENVDIFFRDVISLFLLFQLIEHTKRCLQKNIKKFLCLSFCDMIVPSKSNVPSL